MKPFVIIISFTLWGAMFSSSTFAQRAKRTDSMVSSFAQDTLPVCIGYSHEEQVYFGAVYHTDSVVINDNDTTYTLPSLICIQLQTPLNLYSIVKQTATVCISKQNTVSLSKLN